MTDALAPLEPGLLGRILAAETFHLLIGADDVIHSRGAALVRLHPAPGETLRPAELLKALRPSGMAMNFSSLAGLAGKYLILEYLPRQLKLRGQFVVDPAGDRGVFLGAPWFQQAKEFAAHGLTMDSLPAHYGLVETLFIMQTNEAALGDFRRLSEQLRNQQEELKRAEQEARGASDVKSRFLANMSHEIRTPLHGMLGLTRLLMETEMSDEQREYLEMAMLSGETLLHLVDDVLDLSRLEAGRLPMANEPFRLGEVLGRLEKQFSLRASDADLQLDVGGELPLLDGYLGDDRRIIQVLSNLVGNAIKFSSRGGIIRVRVVEQHREAEHAVLRFSVTDNGIGISEAALAKIFKPFTQADDSTTRRFGGTGLGLSICKQLVELMQGEIWATSTEGAGSCFEFTARLGCLPTVPVAPPSPPPPMRPLAVPETAPVLRDARQVLLVEDNVVSQKIATAFLRKLGCLVQVASNGAEALSLISADRERYSAVLMDCQMPVLNGFDATRALREIERANPQLRRVRIIAMTANAMTGDRERCLEAGMDDYLSKPVDPARLAALLELSDA